MIAVTLACDEGAGAGLGHRRRCESIATALEANGLDTKIVDIADAPVRAPIVVVDSYRVRADDEQWVDADVVIALDDLDRDLAVDCVVDPSPGADPTVHVAARRVLAGAEYVLVDPAILGRMPASLRSDVARVLVTTGAADSQGVGARIAESIAVDRALQVRLALGPWGSRRVPPAVEVFSTRDGLATELCLADVVVCAGGVTLLEAMTLGRPTIGVCLAHNQQRNLQAAARCGAALLSGVDEVATNLAALRDDRDRRTALSHAARSSFDGRGAERVAAVLVDLSREYAKGSAA